MLINEGLPVKRYTRRVKVLPNSGVATTLPGALCESLASLLAPTAQEARSMLHEIRKSCKKIMQFWANLASRMNEPF